MNAYQVLMAFLLYMISLAEILSLFSVDEQENIKKLVRELCLLDVIEIVR
ncbi:hypothetical protein HMPREF0602_1662 [Neisseria meningitidis ATCC 13091]|uniref:Uncharacterized protein n=1 Tax=Neisseria meningitidis serogroup B (strain ATCC 13091 / M2091) TaxID=862513 RepID=E0NAY0_NEIM3|nr:hypothetical protein HMPREF0602_1662 [Neisseria meningitidis ATCC 13091]